jgi:acetyl-CoA synthetase
MSGIIKNFEEYQQAYDLSVKQPEKFWEQQAERFVWKKTWNAVLQGDFSTASIQWFVGGKLNITENCLDRHLKTQASKTAIIWEPNDPKEKPLHISYQELHQDVCKFANVLLKNGIEKGDRVVLYMPMVPQLAIACLACARIGAIHSVVFAGFSAQSLADRINDAQAKAVLTADGNFRGNKTIPVKEVVDQALSLCTSVKVSIVYQRTNQTVNWNNSIDKWWHEELESVSAHNVATEMDSEDVLFILYTSGSTGKPKGVVHTTGGYMVYTEYTFRNVFGLQEQDIYWCTADIGWITGHSYLLYGPLLAGATSLMFEGVPTFPDATRFWQVCERHKVTLFYTAPTAIRALQAFGHEMISSYNLSSLRVLGSVGEPINEEAWHWYHKYIGQGKCPIVDTYWQTETGGFLIAPIANVTPEKPTYATLPLPGIQLSVVDNEGTELEGNNIRGNLCIKFPWPSMIRTTYGDHARCIDTYFGTYKGKYFTGDGCLKDEDGYYRITGRVDDVLNVSGHRLGTAEIENAINQHPKVIESAVVGYPHEIKGQGIYAYLICESGVEAGLLKQEVLDLITKIIGPIAKPDKLQVVVGLPKTRSGKIMRRILRKIAEGDLTNLGDVSTLLDPLVVDDIIMGRLA